MGAVPADRAVPTATTATTASTPRVRVLGVRHHGPGSARAVGAALDADPPEVVLIECPADADGLLGLASHEEMEPPVALLASVVDEPERAAFFPFASFSPEWVAIQWAAAHEVPVRCVDLPARTMLAARSSRAVQLEAGARPIDPIAELAAAAGYDDAERWWEDVIEHRIATTVDGVDADAPFHAVAEAMAAVRQAVEPLGEPADELERWREAHMRAGVRRAVADGFRHIAVVCGAWHVPAVVSALERTRARADVAVLRGLPRAKVALTWVPWTHRRLASRLGYGAGVDAPGWYHHVHTHAGPQVIARWFAEVARVLRAADYPVSAADVIEATRLAEALAVVRGRPLAGLAEVDDATRAALGGGSDAPMRLVSSELVVGAQVGAVPSSTPMVPLARSLSTEQRRCRLRPSAEARLVELDLRAPLDLARSRLLHRLGVLGVPWGRVVDGRGSSGTFRETWSVRWEPEFEVRLIESSALGTTVAAAASAALLQRAASAASVTDLAALVDATLLAGLDEVLPDLLRMLGVQVSVGAEVPRLMEAVPPLVSAVRYGDVRSTAATSLHEVVETMVVRITAGLGPACTAVDDEMATALAVQVAEVQAALTLLGSPQLVSAWHRALGELTERPRVHGVLHGLANRLLADAGVLAADEVERRVSLALSASREPATAAAFIDGFIGASGAVLVHDADLRGVVDRWVCTLSADAFTEVLALLRRTFGAFAPAERRALGESLRQGSSASMRVELIDAHRAADGLHTLGLLLGRVS